jgi:hypothetical protein
MSEAHDELAMTRQAVATVLAHGPESPGENEAMARLIADYFEALAARTGERVLAVQPIELITAEDALTALRVLRVMATQHHLLLYLDQAQPHRRLAQSGLLDGLYVTVEPLLSMLTAYLQTHGELPGGPAVALTKDEIPDPEVEDDDDDDEAPEMDRDALLDMLARMNGATHA